MAPPSAPTASTPMPMQGQAKSREPSSVDGQARQPSAVGMMQSRPQHQPAVTGVGGGIGGSAVYQSQYQPAINNNMNCIQPHNNISNSKINGGNNNKINTSNIFASMAAPEVNNAQHSNNIFHNFATMNSGAVGGGGVGGQMSHAIAASNAHFATYSRGRVGTAPGNTIGAFAQNNDITATYNVDGNGNNGNRDNLTLHRSGSEKGLSKSMGKPSYLRSSQRQTSASETDPSNTIRYAGYLLKRSNFPYTTTPSNDNAANDNTPSVMMDNKIIGGIASLPDLNAMDDSTHSARYALPFGGLDDSQGEGATLFDNQVGLDALLDPSFVALSTVGGAFEPIIYPTSTASTSVTTEDNTAPSTTVEENPCFCSPIVQFLGRVLQTKHPSDALVTKSNGAKDGNYKRSPSKRSSPKKSPISPKPTRPMPIAPNKLSSPYIMPLKPPARSDPVPISPATDRPNAATRLARQESDTDNGGGNLSRSFSNGGRVIIPTVSLPAPKKEYPPKPADYIDPKDGHIWRAKYCILEEGILYFYRTAEEGESEDARIERYESRLYAEEGEDIVLGEVVNVPSSPRGSFAAMASESRRMSSMDQFDLSKSPMPMKKSDLLFHHLNKSPFHRSGSSVMTGYSSFSEDERRRSSINEDGSENLAMKPSSMLHHSNSLATFQADADILWEKRVALDCVGAVRSSEQEHGYHAFELLAYGSDERETDQSDISDRASEVGSVGGQKQEIIDRLIMRAGSSDDMHAWMFEFHRALMSYMQQIVNSVRSGNAGAGARGDMLGMRPDSPQHRRLPSGGKSSFVPKPHSFASSPATGGGGSFHESGFSSNIVGSLSHGHGRNALYRRQVRDKDKVRNASSPLTTPAVTHGGGSSDADDAQLKGKPLMTSIMIQLDSSKDKEDLPNLKDLREEKAGKAAGDASAPVSAAVPKRYVPPHMRNKGASAGAAPKKYVPPHMRNKPTKEGGNSNSGGNGAASVAKEPEVKEVPLNDSPTKETGRSSSDLLDDSLSDSAGSNSLSRQFEEEDDISTSITIRLGGCADPSVVIGSIVDHHFINRKASVVGNARLEAYGGTGGGSFAPFDRSQHCPTRSEETMFDDLELESNNDDTYQRRQSVLKWEVGASSECGIRSSNEDAYVAINNLEILIEKEGLVSFSQQDFGRTKQQGLYCIFDGHVGNQAARYSAEKFPGILIEEESVLASQDSACSIEERADTVLRKAFHRLDEDFCHLCTKDGREWDCGSTALVALIVDDVVSLANLGDCRGVVCRRVSDNASDADTDGWETLEQEQGGNQQWDRANGGDDCMSGGKLLWKEITDTHSPIFDEERTRIENANGWIIEETEIPIGQLHRMDIFDNDVVDIVKRCFADRMKQHRSDPVRQLQIARTCGDLAVSRAIGDRDFKAAYNMPEYNSAKRDEMLAISWEGPLVFLYPEGHSGRFKGDLVSDVPDIKSFKVGQSGVNDEFLVMACDGLWDVMDGDDAVRITKELLFDKNMSAKDGAARLAELAQHLGSSDNITVIVIRFYWEEKKGV